MSFFSPTELIISIISYTLRLGLADFNSATAQLTYGAEKEVPLTVVYQKPSAYNGSAVVITLVP